MTTWLPDCDGSEDCPADHHNHGCFTDLPCTHTTTSDTPIYDTLLAELLTKDPA